MKLKNLLKDKKGIFGLTAIQQFFVIILGLALLAYVIVVIMGTLSGTTILQSASQVTTNQATTSVVTETSQNLPIVGTAGIVNPVCSISSVVNGTSNTAIPSGNYTLTNNGCTIAFTSITASAGNFNNTKWNVTYTTTYNSNAQNQQNSILGNTSTGITGFFSSINPVYAILAVLVIILVLVVLVRVVSAPSGGMASTPQL